MNKLFKLISSTYSIVIVLFTGNVLAEGDVTTVANNTELTQAQLQSIQHMNAAKILEKVDGYRNFKDLSFSFSLELISYRPDKEPKDFKMKAQILNPHVSLISYTYPIKEQGKALLMNKKNLWFISKSSRKPIRITPQQRLLGEASNGDVASSNFSGDYTPTVNNWVSINNQQHVVLDLTAKEGSIAPYHQIKLWVNVADHFKPTKAEFYTKTGKHLKTAYYEQFEPLANFDGKLQLTKIKIENALQPDKKTVMKYSDFELADLNMSQFQPARIKTLMR